MSLEKQIKELGYKKLSDETWKEHCETCKSHPIDGCGKLMPSAHEFFRDIVFQKKLHLFEDKINPEPIIEVAERKFARPDESFYAVGIVYSDFNDPNVVKRMFWESLISRNHNATIEFIEFAEKEAMELMNLWRA